MPSASVSLTLKPTDQLSRYAIHSNHFNTYGVTSLAFMPPKDRKLSVFCTTDLSLQDIKNLAKKNLSGKVYGHAPFFPATAEALGLSADYNNEPERHVDIINWPEKKEQQKTLARRLAEAVNEAGTFVPYDPIVMGEYVREREARLQQE